MAASPYLYVLTVWPIWASLDSLVDLSTIFSFRPRRVLGAVRLFILERVKPRDFREKGRSRKAKFDKRMKQPPLPVLYLTLVLVSRGTLELSQ